MRVERTIEGLVIEVESEDETDRLGRVIGETVCRPNTVIGLVGPLGAGKTRLARSIADALGVDPTDVSSPTFVLIHEYEGRLPVYHFDAYRLGGPDPFEALGVSDYWEAGGVCLVEWADRVAALIPKDAWWTVIEPTGFESRLVRMSGPDVSHLDDALGREGGKV